MLLRKILCVAGLYYFMAPLSSFCQNDSTNRVHSFEIGLRPQFGYPMSHHTQMLYLIQGHVKMGELYFEKIANGKKPWHHAYRSPTVGFALSFTDFGNPAQMGYAISVIPYMKLHFIKRKHFEFNSRLGSGIGFLTKYFDKNENNKNSAIASPWNAAISINFEPEWKTKHVDFGVGLCFSHFSNGAYKTPNLGFNIPTINLAVGYKFNDASPGFNKQKVFDEFKKQTIYEVTLIGGAKEIMPANGPKYFVGGVHFQFRRHYSVKSNFLCFADVNYNHGYTRSYEDWYDTIVPNKTGLRAGIGIGYGLSFDRLLLAIHNGVYLYDKLHYDGYFYHRIVAKYYFDNRLVAMFSLRTHFAKADVVELGIGYTFK